MMNRRLTIFAIVIAILSFVLGDAHAKRMGGGRNVGKQQSALVEREPAAAPAPAAPAGANTPRNAEAPRTVPGNTGGSRLLGPLAGIAGGLGIAALLGYFGVGGELAAVVGSLMVLALFVVLIMLVWRLLRGRAPQPRMQPVYAQHGLSPDTVSALGREGMVYPQPSAPLRLEATVQPGAGLRPIAARSRFGIPEGFDTLSFARTAKIYFVRLQAAWDAGNLADIREFTSPEMYAEIARQLDERGAAPNRTDVVTLDADVLGVTSTDDLHMASVRFYGMLREDPDAPAAAFDEVWNLTKPVAGNGGWVLAGIQQVQTETPYQVEV